MFGEKIMNTLNWKKTFTLCLAVLLFFAIIAAPKAEAVEAICVPWKPSNPSIAHFTYSGAEITLKGIARGGATDYSWDFGDGSPVVSAAISDSYNLGIKHTYSGAVGKLFIATLTVSNGPDTDQDQYLVKIYESSDLSKPDELDVRINMAIDEGLWWLHTNMIRAIYGPISPGYNQPYGYWNESTYGCPLAAVGTAVDAFQLHGSKANLDYTSDPYVETVQRALNYLLYHTYSFPIGLQSAGNPDTNGNGIGLVANQSSNLYDGRQTYIGGICMTALASSGAPNRIAALGGADVYNRKYSEIVQDMADFFAWGQVDSGSGRGGWRYHANYSDSDMSTTQWPPLAMLAAEENMGSTVPQFVRDELIYFLNYTQYTGLDDHNGGFGYNYPDSILNVTKAAAGIICHEFLGTALTDSKVESALGYIYRHWNDTGSSWDDQRMIGNSYGMYGVMKAMRIPNPDITRVTEYDYNAGNQTVNSFDWYYPPNTEPREGLAHYIVRTQQSDGSWDDVPGPNPAHDAFCTGWRILILLKGVTIIPPEAVICDCDEQEYNWNQDINVDGSCSYHPDITRSIVLYEWDWDYDGTFEPDATGVTATKAGGYSATGLYPVALRVTDDNPDNLGGHQTDIYVCDVNVHEPPHSPHAFANGPYLGWVNVPVTFDASASWDPDNEIVLYEWDLDNDGLFGADDDDCFGAADDALGVKPQWTWTSPYYGVIGLKVTDAAYGEFPATSDVDYSTVDIGNHAPVADAGGPYVAPKNYCINLNGTNSKDPDPSDTITYAWDLDGDGEFDDSTESRPEFCVGSEIGKVYDVGLKVTDNFGKYDIDYTTVKIVEYKPVAIDIKPTSCPNPFNANGKGTLPVAIVGTEDFDVSKVDPASVRLVGVAPLRWSIEDECTPYLPLLGKEGQLACTEEGTDGHLDLTLKFNYQQVADALGEVADGDELTLSLKGSLLPEYGGTPILGEDIVVILVKSK
jgi:hypothetical protein